MKIAFASVEEFCNELTSLAGPGSKIATSIWRGQVRFRMEAEPEQKEAVSFRIGLWLTAIAQTPDGEYIMEYADWCGSDDPDAAPNDAGTQEAKRQIELVAVVCKEHGLVLLPGRIEY